jgi:anti-anti-sigma factor
METIVKSYNVHGVTVLKVIGNLDTEGALSLEEAFKGVFALGKKEVVVNLEETGYMSSTGLRVLMFALKKAEPKGGAILLCEVNTEVHKVISMVGYTRFFKLYENEDEAIKSFAPLRN